MFVNKSKYTSNQETTLGLTAGDFCDYNTLNSSWLYIHRRLLIDIDCIWGFVTCYMLHVTLRGLQSRERGEKAGQRIVYINNILFIYTIL